MADCKEIGTPLEPGLKLCKDINGVAMDNSFYKQLVGSLMYLTFTRPDLMYGVSVISRYMERPTEMHLNAAKRILRYVKGTIDYGVFYNSQGGSYFVGFTDSDYAGDIDDRKSTSGHVFMLNYGAITLSSKKQQIVTLSTTEAEFVATASCVCQVIWLRMMLEALGDKQEGSTIIFCDNIYAIKLSRNPVMHGRGKHIDVRFHFLRNLCNDGIVELEDCKSVNQLADILTKSLSFSRN
ncbi:secreted RxLR effector protein 161-like [Malus domestica]|uniref:secreted RxLR effector protein 161-like n=1 Tax=Malus domestica TaxID=3750 RepID=UPI003974965C